MHLNKVVVYDQQRVETDLFSCCLKWSGLKCRKFSWRSCGGYIWVLVRSGYVCDIDNCCWRCGCWQKKIQCMHESPSFLVNNKEHRVTPCPEEKRKKICYTSSWYCSSKTIPSAPNIRNCSPKRSRANWGKNCCAQITSWQVDLKEIQRHNI